MRDACARATLSDVSEDGPPPRPTGKRDMDERVSIPLDSKTALKALMAVDPAKVNGKQNGKRPAKKKPAKS
jgi:hypothetical protein